MKSFVGSLRLKLPVMAAIAAVALALGTGTVLRGNLHAAWNKIHIPANSPSFSDTRSITHSIDCFASGRDPYTVSACDPWGRLLNYPPVWLAARYIGVTSLSSNLAGVLFALAAGSAYLLLFNTRTFLSAAIVFLAMTSRCVLFSVERGNTDQLIFFLLVFGIFLIHHQRPDLRDRLMCLLLVLLTILKVYPIAAVTVFLQRRSGWTYTLRTACVALVALILTSGRKLIYVIVNTPLDSDKSFGTFPFFYSFSRHLLPPLAPVFGQYHAVAPLAALLFGSIGLFAGASSNHHLDRILPPLDSNQPRGAIAIACLSIFCFAFSAGASYDYRLIYLTGALAWLVEDIDAGHRLRSVPAAALILFLLWKPFWLSITGELFDGMVFLMSSVWLGNALFSRGGREHNPVHGSAPVWQTDRPLAPPAR
ncbi:MAG TPA: hypothetical protein VK593_04435 [Edaphobacter sp.]|nr:hypothetical protein [Edaphobacter sp.]